MDFFQYRGTIRGLEMAIRLVHDRCADPSIFAPGQAERSGVRIVEKYRLRRTPGDANARSRRANLDSELASLYRQAGRTGNPRAGRAASPSGRIA